MFVNPPTMDGDEDDVIHRDGAPVDWDMSIVEFKKVTAPL